MKDRNDLCIINRNPSAAFHFALERFSESTQMDRQCLHRLVGRGLAPIDGNLRKTNCENAEKEKKISIADKSVV